ncbi:MAG: CotH kinase family protein [Lachnospiraceae bacterium]|nr:CotH kinase family protein [Lachnospiraceae bacterium]
MSKRRKIAYCFLTVIILVSVFVLAMLAGKLLVTGPDPAGSVSELLIKVTFSDDTEEMISIWPDEVSGAYYAFLPFEAQGGGKACFYNSGNGLSLDGRSFSSGEDLVSYIAEGQHYSLAYRNMSGDTEYAELIFKYLDSIPKVFIYTQSGNLDYLSVNKEFYETGSITVIDEFGNMDYSGTLDSVHLRGNSSFESPKKSFVFELSEERPLLGLGRSEKWYLLAQYMDSTKIRVALANEYMAEHTDLPFVEFRYADVYVNGEYAGLYLIGKNKSIGTFGMTDLEQINEEINQPSELAPVSSADGTIHAFNLQNTPRDHTGGYILEVIPWGRGSAYDVVYPAFCSVYGNCFSIKSPDNASYEEVEYIKSLVDEMEIAIYSPDGINPDTGRHFTDYIDITNWADYYLAKEGFMDNDILMNSSIFICKDSDDVNPKILMGPVWDLDTTFGTELDRRYSHLSNPEYLPMEILYSERLLEYEEVRAEIGRRVAEDLAPWVENEMRDDLLGLYAEMQSSYETDLIRWPEPECYELYSTQSANSSVMLDFMNRRIDFLESYFVRGEKWHKVYFDDGEMIYMRYMVRDGEPLKWIPNPFNYLAFLAGWNVDGEEHSNSLEDIRVTSDITLHARWIDASWLLSGDVESIDAVLRDTEYITLDINELRDFSLAVSEIAGE